MKYFKNEQTLWESKNKQLILTTHRIREINKSIFGSTIKSILLEELKSSELRAIRKFSYLRRAVSYFLIINISVFLLNNYLFKAEIIKFLFNEVHIGPDIAGLIFYFSIAVSLIYLGFFIFSFKKVFSFYAVGMTLDFQLHWLDFNERESFISKVEEAKEQRHQQLYSNS